MSDRSRSAGAAPRSEARYLRLEARYLGDESGALGPARGLAEQWERAADARPRAGSTASASRRVGW